MEFEHLFNPIKIRGMELKNRVMMSGMVTKLAVNGGFVPQELIDYHVARAKGGTGLNMVEATSVHAPSASKTFLAICDDEFIPGFKKLTDAIHEAGGKAGIQLWQGGLVATMLDSEAECVIPSEIKMPVAVLQGTEGGELIFPAASIETIHEVTKAFGTAAGRAAKAGFDCVEFHVAHGYSAHNFLSAGFNQRTDEYGGSLVNRARFALECIKAIRQNIPQDMPLFMRIGAQDDGVENGLTIEDVIRFCKMAGKAGVDAVDISRGNAFTSGVLESPPIDYPRGFNVENAAKIKKATNMITLTVGRINDPKLADDIIAENKADMVVMGRALLADPEFCNKAFAGDFDGIIRCVGCCQGCDDIVQAVGGPHITCMRNPAIGREREFALVKTDHPKKVLVAGGGMAGLEAAIILKKRGHNPVLFEESDQLGGQFILAGMAPRKNEMREAAVSRGKQAVKEGVDIRLSTPVTRALLEKVSPEAVIVSTGASPIKLNIPGADLPNVSNFVDVLTGKVKPAGNVAVIGGGLVGLEVAEYLAERHNKVTVLEMLDEVGKDLGPSRKICVMDAIDKAGIKTMVNTKCAEIRDKSIVVEKDGKNELLSCDHVVIAVGSKPENYDEIKNYCEEKNVPYYIVGDAKQARRALNAIAEAAETARII